MVLVSLRTNTVQELTLLNVGRKAFAPVFNLIDFVTEKGLTG